MCFVITVLVPSWLLDCYLESKNKLKDLLRIELCFKFSLTFQFYDCVCTRMCICVWIQCILCVNRIWFCVNFGIFFSILFVSVYDKMFYISIIMFSACGWYHTLAAIFVGSQQNLDAGNSLLSKISVTRLFC